MKRILTYLGGILLCLVCIPATIVLFGGHHKKEVVQAMSTQTVAQDEEKLLLEQEMIGILAKEVPVYYHYEAVRANAVILRTYMKNQADGKGESQFEALTINQMRDLWKEDYEEVYELYRLALYDTTNEILQYDGEIIEPVYHRESGGYTRDAVDVYGVDVPYLKAVESPCDVQVQVVSYSKEQIVQMLESIYPNSILDVNYIAQQIQIVQKDKSGHIQQIQFGSIILNEEEFMEIFGLNSSNITLDIQDKKINFLVNGSGHGLGLSQNGANEMAMAGATYRDILKHYFSGVDIVFFME
ncbi:MAG: hypothetical protein ATN36_08215 [Epulopiscium sp. Nele67-Bin005]|nr:MAG: hypothetical protein ATN36_08215 [Epulopiscium sp. Nele67-Bin005]